VHILNVGNRATSSKILPIRFITPKNQDEFTFKEDEEENEEEIEKSSPNYFDYEFGLKYLNDFYLVVNSELPFFTISRDIEFYNQSSFSPYFRLNFKDIEIVRRGDIFFRNSLEADYFSHTKQVPFYSDSGEFPYGKVYDIGTKIDDISLFWRGFIFYKASFFSIGAYIGGGVNIMSGEASYLRYAPSDINSSISSSLGYFQDGVLLEKGESINLDTTTSVLGKYGLEMGFDFWSFHLGFGIDYGVTSEANLYWFERSYFMELSYIF